MYPDKIALSRTMPFEGNLGELRQVARFMACIIAIRIIETKKLQYRENFATVVHFDVFLLLIEQYVAEE